MAEDKAAAAELAAPVSAAPSGQKPTLFIILAIFNMIVVGAVGFMLYKGRQKEAEKPTLDHVIQGEHEAQEHHEEEKAFVGKVVPLETFIVNLAQSKGRKVVKVNMELELANEHVAEEIEKRKPQIRDIIIITLSSKSFEEISSREGKEALRAEIKDTINNFLTKGKIKNVFFTDLIYN